MGSVEFSITYRNAILVMLVRYVKIAVKVTSAKILSAIKMRASITLMEFLILTQVNVIQKVYAILTRVLNPTNTNAAATKGMQETLVSVATRRKIETTITTVSVTRASHWHRTGPVAEVHA